MKALRIIAAALGKRLGGVSVTVDPRAQTAYTNGKRVVLPFLPDVAGDELEDLLLGLTAHEAFHIRFTYNSGRDKGVPPTGVRITPFINRLANCLEDPRIEHLGMDAYRGVRTYLEKLIQYGRAKNWFNDSPKDDEHPGNLVIFALLYLYRAHYLGQHDLDVAAKNWGDAVCKAFGADLWQKIISIADPAVRASAEDALDGPWWAAKQISDLLGDATKGLPEDQQQAARKAREAQEGDLDAVDLADMAGDSVAAARAGDNSFRCDPVKTERTFSQVPDTVKLEAGRIYRQICGPLEAKLWARSQEEVYTSRTGTSGVVATALHRVATTGQIFGRHIEGDSRSIAVKVVVDLSGSMGRIQDRSCSSFWATAGALALTRLFSGLGIEYSVSWFGTYYVPGRPFSSAPLKPNDLWESNKLGGTATNDAMSRAGIELIGHTADRKLLIVLTDDDVDEEAVSAIDHALGTQGVEVRYALLGAITGFDFAKGRIGIGGATDAGKVLVQAFSSFAI